MKISKKEIDMNRDVVLFRHQDRFLKKNPAKILLCWDTGTGKTLASILWAEQNSKRTIIICPKALKENWRREIEKFSTNTGYFKVVSKEEFRRDWNTLPHADAIIVDEAHYFSGMRNYKNTSQMAKSLLFYCKKHDPGYLLLATATPYMSTPWNIFMLAKHLGHKWNYQDFKRTFFEQQYFGTRSVPKIKDDIEPAIAELVGGLGDIVRLEDCVDVPEQIFEFEYFELTPAQKKAKKEIIDISIVRFTKHHQIENGTLKSDGYTEDEFFKCDKNDRIVELCQQHKKVAIIARYNLQLDNIEDELRDIKKPIYMIRGDVKNRDEIVQQIEKDDECVVLINASCSEGYELPSVGMIIFASVSFSFKDYKQITGRFLRINRLKKNVYLHLVSEGIDKDVYEAIKNKQDFDLHIYARKNY